MDEALERRIDEAGRDRVFARARAMGWTSDSLVPKYVWRQLAEDIINGVAPPPDLRPLHEQVLGFRLW